MQMQEILPGGLSRLPHIKSHAAARVMGMNIREFQVELTAGISHMQVKRSPNEILRGDVRESSKGY